MHFPVVIRYLPTKWEAYQNSPSRFVTLNYQNRDTDLPSTSPTRHPQPLYAAAPTARKRYLQPLSAESFEKPVHESLQAMAAYGVSAKERPFRVVEAEWYLDVTNVAQRLKLLRETYKVIQSVRKKKLMGERADFQSLFDMRLSSPHAVDEDRPQPRSDDDEYPVHKVPPIPNRRGRPRKKRGVDRKPPMARSDHKRTRASRRIALPESAVSPGSVPSLEQPEGHLNVESPSSNERLATGSPHPSSQVFNDQLSTYNAIGLSSPATNETEKNFYTNRQNDTQEPLFGREERNIFEVVSRLLNEDGAGMSFPNEPFQLPTSDRTASLGLINELYTEQPLNPGHYGTPATEAIKDEQEEGYLDLLRELDQHLLSEATTKQSHSQQMQPAVPQTIQPQNKQAPWWMHSTN